MVCKLFHDTHITIFRTFQSTWQCPRIPWKSHRDREIFDFLSEFPVVECRHCNFFTLLHGHLIPRNCSKRYAPLHPRQFALARTARHAAEKISRREDRIDSLETIHRRLNPRRISSDGRLLLSLLLHSARPRRLFVSAHRVLTLQQRVGRRRGR